MCDRFKLLLAAGLAQLVTNFRKYRLRHPHHIVIVFVSSRVRPHRKLHIGHRNRLVFVALTRVAVIVADGQPVSLHIRVPYIILQVTRGLILSGPAHLKHLERCEGFEAFLAIETSRFQGLLSRYAVAFVEDVGSLG